ncbi:response regulator transcription factor [Eubacteriaceae bacterium ES2]|nr:response regulator transcription factor [Eubacteriaceae bacterium ES2]
MNAHILIIDDDDDLRRLLKRCFENEGYCIDTAADGLEGLKKSRTGDYDLIILDIMLPGINGIRLLEKIRQFSIVPVILLSAKEQEIDIVDGLKSGADDYITKPFHLSEIIARVESVLRRCEMLRKNQPNSPNVDSPESVIIAKNLVLNRHQHVVMKDGQEILLTLKEFELLCFLSDRPGQIYSKQQIYQNVWHDEYLFDDNAIMTLIRRLRTKIEESPSKPVYIQTVRGLGYRFIRPD